MIVILRLKHWLYNTDIVAQLYRLPYYLNIIILRLHIYSNLRVISKRKKNGQ